MSFPEPKLALSYIWYYFSQCNTPVFFFLTWNGPKEPLIALLGKLTDTNMLHINVFHGANSDSPGLFQIGRTVQEGLSLLSLQSWSELGSHIPVNCSDPTPRMHLSSKTKLVRWPTQGFCIVKLCPELHFLFKSWVLYSNSQSQQLWNI